MTNAKELKSALFQISPNLIVKRVGEECHALLYEDKESAYVCKGLQADLIYWLSQSFTIKTFQEIFASMDEIYDVDPLTLSNDLEVSLRHMEKLNLISIQQ